MAVSTFYWFLILSSIYSCVNSERLHEQIYSSIEGGAACFRRLNGTHQAGCSSADNGAVGVVQMIRGVEDAQWLVQNSTAGPYMAVVSTALFYDVIELFMDQPAYISGVLLYDNATHSPSSFTQESRCPNEYYSGPNSTCSSSVAGGIVWNEKGTGLLRRDIPFPIFYLPKSRSEEIVKIEQCYEKFNVDKSNQDGAPLCSLQLNSFMFAAVNSEVCLRRSAASAVISSTKVCDPLGDNNVYYSLFPRTMDTKPAKPVTLVTARIDTATLFDGVSPGAMSSVVGMVTLLTAATTLSQLIPVKDEQLYNHNVLWTLFNGEAFDYIGSQRVAYDISRGAWPAAAPLAPADIRLHVELGQIGGALANVNADSSWPIHAFVPYDSPIPEITEFLNEMLTNTQQFNMSLSSEFTKNLPPSSLHSFRRILNTTLTGDLPEVLLADHKSTFTNMFYHSALDDFDKIYFNYRNITIDANGTFISTEDLIANGTMKESDPQVKIARLATALARTLYHKVAGKAYSGTVVASAHLVDEMLYCFLRSQACRLISAAEYASSGAAESPAERAAPLYVGVAAWSGVAPVFVGHLLALLTGSRLPDNRTACNARTQPGYTHYYLRGWNHTGVCIQTTMNISAAVSPAFLIPDYDLKSGVYSSWTESVWAAMWARVFVRASGGGARLAAGAGAAATLLAAALTYWLQRHSARLFAPSTVAIVADDAASGILRTVNC
ncbi:nicastrin [Anticarsia gemmatalis]|uniref:nicastrin n=1 Tax=Anticarsia gemmatalis TaxID=129554 RepID=UPI003F7666DA